MKKIEQTVKTSQARRRTKVIVSNDEEDLVAEDPSKQGRSIIEEMDLDAEIKLLPRDILGRKHLYLPLCLLLTKLVRVKDQQSQLDPNT
ncbi:hypothetical protein Tco_0263022 [Tanacetum coccineum]